MGWTTILSAAVAAVCLTLAAIHLGIWWRDRNSPAHLEFSVLAVAVAAYAWGCLAMMRASTPEAFGTALVWSNVAIFAMVAGVVAFVRSYFRTSRPWLGHLAWGVRLVTLVVSKSTVAAAAYVNSRLFTFSAVVKCPPKPVYVVN